MILIANLLRILENIMKELMKNIFWQKFVLDKFFQCD